MQRDETVDCARIEPEHWVNITRVMQWEPSVVGSMSTLSKISRTSMWLFREEVGLWTLSFTRALD